MSEKAPFVHTISENVPDVATATDDTKILAEEAQAAGPQAVPESTVGHSPTVYGGV